jgi:hypothetical protein
MAADPTGTRPSQVLLYKEEEGSFRLEVPTDGDTVWLTQQQMADLFGKARTTIVGHIGNIFEEGELIEEVVCRDFRHTTPHGAMEGKTQTKAVRHYYLDEEELDVLNRIDETSPSCFRGSGHHLFRSDTGLGGGKPRPYVG